jgi:trans-aconitate methyltransferase
MSYEIAREFWQQREEYPNYPNTLQRRLIDTNYIVPRVEGAESLVDLGCGDGSMIMALREFTTINKYYAFDLSPNLLKSFVARYGNIDKVPKLFPFVGDLLTFREFPEANVTLSMGSFPYVFKDEDLVNILSKIRSDTFIVRAPCSISKHREVVNTYSEDLGAQYASVYRSVANYIDLFHSYFVVHEICRAYPDAIESKYGTKQFFFVCRR